MSIRALYPARQLLNDLKAVGSVDNPDDVLLYAKLQGLVDTGATMVMVSGEDAEHLIRRFMEHKQPKETTNNG